MRVSNWRPLGYAMLAVVASFLGSIWYTQFRLARIETYTSDIAGNAAPSIVLLAGARAELRALTARIQSYIDQSPDDTPTHAEMDAHHAAFEQYLARYSALPFFNGEHPLYDQALRAMGTFDHVMADVLAAASPRLPRDERLAMHREVRRAAAAVDDKLDQIVAFDARQTERESAQIASTRRRATATAAGLGAFSVLMALAATLLAYRAFRDQARVVAERDRLREERARELEAFAGRVAHDLKNPVGAIALRLMMAEARGLVDERLSETFARLKQQVSSMNQVIDGLLEFALAGAAPKPGARAELSTVIEGVIEECRPSADATQAQLAVEPFAAPLWVAASPGALTSMLGNLVRNAVKYAADADAAERRVVVRATVRGGGVHIEVEDRGPGLPLGSEQAIFAPFVRAAIGKPGIGLGLATVRRLAEAHGGGVGARSLEQGALFWLELPLADATTPAGADADDESHHALV